VISYELYIDGSWTGSDGDAVLSVLNPATEEVIGQVPEGTVADIDRAVGAARRAFDGGPWPWLSARERAAALLRFADALEARFADIVDLNVLEVGSVRSWAEFLQVGLPMQHFRDMAERVMAQYRFETPMAPTLGGGTFGSSLAQGVVRREPRGVAALVSAYNAPTMLNLVKLAPALAAGCTVVLKPAPSTPLETLLLGEVADAAGLPPGVLNIVTGDIAAGQALTSHPGVDVVSFTGSDAVGRLVYAQAAPTLKKVILELGGKSASIILPDADLSRAAASVAVNMTAQAGQGCSLLTRTLVHESLFDELVGRVKTELDAVLVGDPADPAVTMGPLISAAQRAKVEALIQAGRDEGAQIAYGGGRPAGLDRGFFVEPTLFVDVDNSMTIARKEFFGPVGVVIPFSGEAEAIRLANDSEFGLAAGVWSADPVRAYQVATRIRAGLVYLNGGGAGSSPHTPFGGYKASGLGVERGEYGLEEFLLAKSIIWSAR
jgi:acyl-CoA reductase-like NAD-dependent aldehyde dehydrogenase